MERNSEMKNGFAAACELMKYERPELQELTDVLTVLGAGEHNWGGSASDFGAAGVKEDYSGDYTDFELDD